MVKRRTLRASALSQLIAERGWLVEAYEICPDDCGTIEAAIVAMAEAGADVVLTCGGTGLGPRDVTPEATLAVCDREVPGIAEHIRAESLKVTGRAMLSRASRPLQGAARSSSTFPAPRRPRASASGSSPTSSSTRSR